MLALSSAFGLGCSAAAVDADEEEVVSDENAIVNVVHTDVERQSIGNCWIYAHATWLESMHKRATGESFDSSQSYMTYWDWFHKILDGDVGSDGVQTGGSWQLANNLVRRYGVMAEKDFVAEDLSNEMSFRQSSALSAINASLSSGALKTSEARRDKKLILAELNRAWALKPEVITQLQTAFGDSAQRSFASGSTASSAGTSIIRPQDFRVAYPSRSTRGTVSVRTASLSTAMNAWREVYYSRGSRSTMIKVQRAMHAQAPVIITWNVDFNALENSDPVLKGSFNMTTLRRLGKPGRQGGHLTVLEDYQAKLPNGELLQVNKDVTDTAKLEAALQTGTTIEFLQVKNSWGASRVDRGFAPGMPGYHNLYMDYLNGPITWCSESEDTGTPEERGCNWTSTPARNFVLPPGFDR
jgi:hypothetical protein